MTLLRRSIQYFFLFFGIILAVMFVIRWVAPDARFMLWQVLCPPSTHIERVPGSAELEPGEVVSAYEVACVGGGIRQPVSDIQLILVETGYSIGTALLLGVTLGWISARRSQQLPHEMAIL